MKRLHYSLLTMLLIVFAAFNVQATVHEAPDLSDNPELMEISEEMQINTMQAFLNLTPKKIKEATGKKLKLKEVVALKVMQKRIKKQMKKSPNADLSKGLYILLAILGWGFIGMGINSNWDGQEWIICLVLGLLTCIGGMIYALVKMKNYY